MPGRGGDPNFLVGTETADDAGVYRLADGMALVQTLDFFPPLVDDPFTYGQIAAANALSDVYAMNGAAADGAEHRVLPRQRAAPVDPGRDRPGRPPTAWPWPAR